MFGGAGYLARRQLGPIGPTIGRFHLVVAGLIFQVQTFRTHIQGLVQSFQWSNSNSGSRRGAWGLFSEPMKRLEGLQFEMQNRHAL